MTDVGWSNIFGANRRLANAKSSMFQENGLDAVCMYVRTSFDMYERESTARHRTAPQGRARRRRTLRC